MAKLKHKENNQNETIDVEQTITETESEAQDPKKIVRHEWILEATFRNEKSCIDFINSENCWARKKQVPQTIGLKTLYRCNHCKLRGKVCSAEIYTISNSSPEDKTFKLYRKQAVHDHDESGNKVSVMSDEVKNSIRTYVSEGLTLKKILYRFRDKTDIVQPTKAQVESQIKRCRKELFGDSAISVTEMVKFCEEHSSVPDDIDEAFILAYEHSPLNSTDDEYSDESDDEETSVGQQRKGNWIRIIATTKRLLANSARSIILHADTTYKIVIQRYPILNFGTTDKDNTQHFHLMAMMISKYERTDDFAFAFKALKDGVLRITGVEFKPTVLMSDAAAAIGNAFKSTFGNEVTVMMCFTHVMAAVDRKAMVNKDNKALIKADVRKLRLAPSKVQFEIGCGLFLEKWSEREKSFTEVFEQQWIAKNYNWFNGAHYRVPTTNNALEGFHSNLKMHQTYYRQKGLAEFKVLFHFYLIYSIFIRFIRFSFDHC